MEAYEHDDVKCIHHEIYIQAEPTTTEFARAKWQWAIRNTIHRRRSAIHALEKAREAQKESLRVVNSGVVFK